MITLSLQSSIIEYTGISNVFIADLITGLVFGVGILLIVGLLVKFLFRLL